MAEQINDGPDRILVGKSGKYEYLTLAFGNRHGLITGATGTGKTVSLQVLAEGFSASGVAVFAADVKGDLAGLAMPGDGRPVFVQRARDLGLAYAPIASPVVFWDLFGAQGHPIRATISEMGPQLLARILELNEVQEGVLNIAFKIADEQGLLLLDLKDLRALLQHLAQNAATLTTAYGNVAPATVGTIQRQLLVLENQGAANFFGEPALDLADFMRTDSAGRGVVNILAADRLMRSPRLYATFLLWFLTQLFHDLPEAGDLPAPKMAFFFDEAHLLFNEAPKSLLTSIEQIVRLIRSKGVGVYFVTQNPIDVPVTVLGQLGNRIQHALRAFTPLDQRGVKAAADTFRQNPAFDTARVITQLGVGEALVSMLEGRGTPEMVERALIIPPASRAGPLSPEERRRIIAASPLLGKYETAVDRESAYEMLQKRAQGFSPQGPAAPPAQAAAGGGVLGHVESALGGLFKRGPRGGMSAAESAARGAAQSFARSIGTQIARAVLRGVMGGILK